MLSGESDGASQMDKYLSIITFVSAAAFALTLACFKEKPLTAPSSSAAAHQEEEAARRDAIAAGGADPWITYPADAAALFRTPGFLAPTLAFVASLGVTNAVSSFTAETMLRAGMHGDTLIDGAGAGFQVM